MAIISNLVVQAMICKAFEPHDLVGAFAVWADRLRRRLVRDSRAAELVFLAFSVVSVKDRNARNARNTKKHQLLWAEGPQRSAFSQLLELSNSA